MTMERRKETGHVLKATALVFASLGVTKRKHEHITCSCQADFPRNSALCGQGISPWRPLLLDYTATTNNTELNLLRLTYVGAFNYCIEY